MVPAERALGTLLLDVGWSLVRFQDWRSDMTYFNRCSTALATLMLSTVPALAQEDRVLLLVQGATPGSGTLYSVPIELAAGLCGVDVAELTAATVVANQVLCTVGQDVADQNNFAEFSSGDGGDDDDDAGAAMEADAAADAETDAGSDADADAGSDAGSDAEAEADAGADAGTDTGGDTGADAGGGADAGVDVGADAGTEADADAGAGTDTDAGGEAGTDADAGGDASGG